MVAFVVSAPRFGIFVPSPWAVDLVRAMSVIIAVTWVLMYALIGQSAIAMYYERVLFARDKAWLAYAIRAIDVLVHTIPVVILGLPHRVTSYPYAIVIMGLWYVLMRPYLIIFLKQMSIRMSDIVLYFFYPVIAILLIIWRALY